MKPSLYDDNTNSSSASDEDGTSMEISIHSTSTSYTSNSSSRTVRFHPKVRSKRAIRYSGKEAALTWYDRHELEELQFEQVRQYRAVQATMTDNIEMNHTAVKDINFHIDESLSTLDEDNNGEMDVLCSRGLEGFDDHTKKLSHLAVLQEQQFQNENGRKDVYKLAGIYITSSESCQLVAQQRGASDAKVAYAIGTSSSNDDQEQNHKASLGERSTCQRRASLLLARRREERRRKLTMRL